MKGMPTASNADVISVGLRTEFALSVPTAANTFLEALHA